MKTHKFQETKFPVGDSVIYHFKKLILDKLNVDCWIDGGAITSYLSGDKIKDIDLFALVCLDTMQIGYLTNKEMPQL